MASAPIRVLVAKPGLDGHDRGAKLSPAHCAMRASKWSIRGCTRPEMIVEAAIQEDVDAIGMSVLSGAHMTLFAAVIELLKERDASDIVVFGGGIIPEDDIAPLTELGVAKVFIRHNNN